MSGPINPTTITFDAPTKYTDGTTIPPGGIASYEYGFTQTAGGPYSHVVADTDFTPDVDGKQTATLDLAGFAFGQWFAAGRAVSSDGQASDWSNEAAFELQAKKPGPPVNFSLG